METFVVRIWAPAEPADSSPGDGIHGRIEHVRSGRSTTFSGVTELAVALREGVGLPTATSVVATGVATWSVSGPVADSNRRLRPAQGRGSRR